MRGIVNRWIGVAAVVAVGLAAAGCAHSVPAASDASHFVVLGSDGGTGAVVAAPTMPGLDANSVPQDGIKGVPGASDVVVASGSPAISRDRAIEIGHPSDGTLVSAIYVLLPKIFVAAVVNNPKTSKPTTAWIVTWTGVTQQAHGGAYAPGKVTTPTPVRHGDTTVVIDATTGEQLLATEYPTPNSTTGQGVVGAGVTP
ncbi:MAG: hypothetical protein P4L93_00525 [Coriobacteriia bacterium]|nr:hypothetical protein [Coriobacteriia bacterium]